MISFDDAKVLIFLSIYPPIHPKSCFFKPFLNPWNSDDPQMTFFFSKYLKINILKDKE